MPKNQTSHLQFRSEKGEKLVISSISEESLSTRYLYFSLGGIIGGPIFVALGIYLCLIDWKNIGYLFR
jgi:hypothetical protein